MGIFTYSEEGKPHKRRKWSARFSIINRSSKTEAHQASSTRSPTTRKDPTKRETTSDCLSDRAEWRKLNPSLGHQTPKFFDIYKPLKTIGTGQYGTVFEVEERHPPPLLTNFGNKATDYDISDNEQPEKPRVYACKVVDILPRGLDNDRSRSLEDFQNEVKILLAGPGGGHPNVQDLVDFAVEDDKAYIVSSLCRGGDLAQALEMRGCLCEEDARNAMAGILSGLAHLHSRGVVHRDIKLENVLLAESKHDMSKVKIIDMGFAMRLATCPGATRYAETDNNICGTPLYIAPELLRSTVQRRQRQTTARYGTQADMWSCGVILYCLLSGCPPFIAKDGAYMFDLFKDIVNSSYDFSDPVWQTVSGEALSMITCLLEADPARRLTAEEALRHPWMMGL